jgi:ketosteroid isomerase-like protein
MTDHTELLEEVLAAFNAHDLDAIMAFFTDDCVLETPRGPHPWGTRFEGPDQVRDGLAQRFRGLPDVHYGDDEHWSCGDHGVSRWLLTGTTPERDKVQVRGCDLFDLADDGRIRRKDSYWKIVQAQEALLLVELAVGTAWQHTTALHAALVGEVGARPAPG